MCVFFFLSPAVDIRDSFMPCSLPSFSKGGEYLSLQHCTSTAMSWGRPSFEQGCWGHSPNESQGTWTCGTGGASYDVAWKNGDKCSTLAMGCAFNSSLKIWIKRIAEDWHIWVLVSFIFKHLSGSEAASESSDITWTISAQGEELYISLKDNKIYLPSWWMGLIVACL